MWYNTDIFKIGGLESYVKYYALHRQRRTVGKYVVICYHACSYSSVLLFPYNPPSEEAGEKGKISVDAYDPNDLRVKLKGQYEVAQDTYLIGQIKDINDSDERAAYVGLRHEF